MRMGKVQYQLSYFADLDNKAQVDAAKTLIIGCLDESGCDLEYQQYIEEHTVEIEDSSLLPTDVPREVLTLAELFEDE